MFWSQTPNNMSVKGHLYIVNFGFWHMYEESTMWDKVSEPVFHAIWENLLCLCGVYEQNPHFALSWRAWDKNPETISPNDGPYLWI